MLRDTCQFFLAFSADVLTVNTLELRLRLLPFDPKIYDQLRDRLLGALGLTAAENIDHYDKRQMEQVNAQAQELEKMMAALRKFAQVDD